MAFVSASDEQPVRRGLLRHNRRFRIFWSARAISFVGDGIATIALLLYVKQRDDTGLAVAGLLLASGVPRLLGPLAGTVVDRLRVPIPLMVSCDLGQAAIYLVVAGLRPPLPLLFALVIGASVLATLFRPAGSGLVPRLVATDQLLQANSWVGLALNLQVVCGPPLGAFAFQLFGIRGALVINAVTFLVSAALLSRLGRLPSDHPTCENFRRPSLPPSRHSRESVLSACALGIDGEQHLPEAVGRFEARVGLGGAGERIDAVDRRAPRRVSPMLEEGVELAGAAERCSLDAQEAEEEVGDRDAAELACVWGAQTRSRGQRQRDLQRNPVYAPHMKRAQRSASSSASSRLISFQSRLVASVAAACESSSFRSSSGIGAPKRSRSGPSRLNASSPRIATGISATRPS